MLPDRVSNPGPLTYEPGALPIALRGPAYCTWFLKMFTDAFKHNGKWTGSWLWLFIVKSTDIFCSVR